MPTLRERFTQDLKDAMKASEKSRVSTLRLMQSALKDKDIEARGLGKDPISDEDILALLQKMIKQRNESITMYVQGGREELAAIERDEVAIISIYLPKQLDDAAMQDVIQSAIAHVEATSMKDMGKVVAHLKANYSGQMDFAKVSGFVKVALGSLAS